MTGRLDTRRLSPSRLARLRQRAVALVARGMAQGAVSRRLQVRRASLSQWLKRFREGGKSALTDRSRGRKSLLPDGSLAARIQQMLRLPPPGFALWTIPVLCQEIHNRWQVSTSRRACRGLLRIWGIVPKPGEWARNPHICAVIRTHPPVPKPVVITERPLATAESDIALCAFKRNGEVAFLVAQKPLRVRGFISFLERLTRHWADASLNLLMTPHPIKRTVTVQRWFRYQGARISHRFIPAP